jgi:nucleoside-diphosphate-sugar epimerase
VFNVACGEATTLNQVVELLGGIVDKKIPIEYAPGRVGDIKHSLADITEARTRLGYKGAVTFLEGLRRTVTWYAERQKK